MKNIKRILTTLLLMVLFAATVHAQQTYRALQGTIVIIMPYKDTTLMAESNLLMVSLNYETGEIRFKVPYESFRTGVNVVDTVFLGLNGIWLEYSGVLGVAYINTKKHPPQSFDVDGTIFSSFPQVSVKAKGTLTHTPSGSISCVLTIKMPITLSELNIRDIFPTMNDSIQIYIQEAILKRVNE